MKSILVALLLVSSFSSSALADSPEAILKDYRKQAAQAVERLNQSLEKAATPLITKLVKDGDTDGAEEFTAQLKAKIAGESVSKPQASAVQLFSLYDEARVKALTPVQKSSIARIDSLLKTAGGAKLEMVTELGKARAEIEAGKVQSATSMPMEWTYHGSPTSTTQIATVVFRTDGTMEMDERGQISKGTWKANMKGDKIIINILGMKWAMELTKDPTLATVDRPDVGRRYLKVKQ